MGAEGQRAWGKYLQVTNGCWQKTMQLDARRALQRATQEALAQVVGL